MGVRGWASPELPAQRLGTTLLPSAPGPAASPDVLYQMSLTGPCPGRWLSPAEPCVPPGSPAPSRACWTTRGPAQPHWSLGTSLRLVPPCTFLGFWGSWVAGEGGGWGRGARAGVTQAPLTPSGRMSAGQCLQHPWLNNLAEKAKRCNRRLKSQVLLKKYVMRRRWKVRGASMGKKRVNAVWGSWGGVGCQSLPILVDGIWDMEDAMWCQLGHKGWEPLSLEEGLPSSRVFAWVPPRWGPPCIGPIMVVSPELIPRAPFRGRSGVRTECRE